MHVIPKEAIEVADISVAQLACYIRHLRHRVTGEKRQSVIKADRGKSLLQADAVACPKLPAQGLLRHTHLSRNGADGEPGISMLTIDDVINQSGRVVEHTPSGIARRIASALPNRCDGSLLDVIWVLRLLSGHEGSPKAKSATLTNGGSLKANRRTPRIFVLLRAFNIEERSANSAALADLSAVSVARNPLDSPLRMPRWKSGGHIPLGASETNRCCDAEIGRVVAICRKCCLHGCRPRMHHASNAILSGNCQEDMCRFENDASLSPGWSVSKCLGHSFGRLTSVNRSDSTGITLALCISKGAFFMPLLMRNRPGCWLISRTWLDGVLDAKRGTMDSWESMRVVTNMVELYQ